MIVYSSTKQEFINDVMTNGIGDIIFEAYKAATGHGTSKSEINSWINSMQYMERVLHTEDLPDNMGVAIEYHIPQSSKRVDLILTGTDEHNQETAILVELKQWQTAKQTLKDGIVSTRFSHGEQEVIHPSYQAWSYKCLLQDFNETIHEENVQLVPCAYLHNYEQDDVITNDFYEDYLKEAPVFLKHDAIKLQNFLKQHIKYGDNSELIYRIEQGKIKPSKALADNLASMLQGNQEFIMIDDQKIAYETALELAKKAQTSTKKQILIIQGGPGTGKSVVAINLLVELTKQRLLAQYITRNAAPREVYQAKLTGSIKKSHISNLFRGSGGFTSADSKDLFDVLIVDEAHRLNEKSGMFQNLGENQVKEIINAAKLSIFFIDEDQKVTLKDIGDVDEVHFWGMHFRAETTELKLESQFRCNGSDGYIAWLDNTLEIRKTANESLEGINYDFRIFDDPKELFDAIKEKNKITNKSRLLAGYCWDWKSANDPSKIDIVIGDFKATWNLKSQGQSWIIQPNSVEQVGCIHTTQGLELDYVGVIIGPDMTFDGENVRTHADKRAKTDRSVAGWRKLMDQDPTTTGIRLDMIIKNTYRTLMTRGQKGCYIYVCDQQLKQYIEMRLKSGISN